MFNNYSLKEKVLINENFKLENKTLKKNNKKFDLYNINEEINKASYSTYKIRICDDY